MDVIGLSALLGPIVEGKETSPMPLAHWRTHRERARQKRKVLQMLALSGVVRPSHVEFHYTVPILKVGTSTASPRRKPAADRKQSASIEEPSEVVRTWATQLLQGLCQRLPLGTGQESLGLNWRGLTNSL
jgi:hypothetical protein